jgi:hypothetical protein
VAPELVSFAGRHSARTTRKRILVPFARRCLALLAAALALAPAAADAQLFRTYLTVDGLDANPARCSCRAASCLQPSPR